MAPVIGLDVTNLNEVSSLVEAQSLEAHRVLKQFFEYRVGP